MPMSGSVPAAAAATIFSKRSPTIRLVSYSTPGYRCLNSATNSAPTSSLNGNWAFDQCTILPRTASGPVGPVGPAVPAGPAQATTIVAGAATAADRTWRRVRPAGPGRVVIASPLCLPAPWRLAIVLGPPERARSFPGPADGGTRAVARRGRAWIRGGQGGEAAAPAAAACCAAPAAPWRPPLRPPPYAWAGAPRPVSRALTSQRRRCAASSLEAGDDAAGRRLTQYLPVTPATSGEDARY